MIMLLIKLWLIGEKNPLIENIKEPTKNDERDLFLAAITVYSDISSSKFGKLETK